MNTKLTTLQIDALKKPGKHRVGGDGCGYLYVEVSKAGGKVFRLKYRLDGKENRYTIGAYPKTSLKQARDEAVRARALIDAGRHPAAARDEAIEVARREAVLAQAHLFRVVAERYFATKTKLAASTLGQYQRALENHIYPVVGDLPVADVRVSHVDAIIQRLKHKPTMARYALGVTKSVLGHAELLELVPRNVAAGKSGLLPDHSTKSHAAFTEPAEHARLGDLLRRLNDYEGANGAVGNALRLLVRIACRPAEIVAMRWQDVDLDEATWRYIITKTKGRDGKPKIQFVPLSRQSVAILRPLHEASEGRGYVFPSPGNAAGHIRSDSLLAALINGLGYKRGQITAHGFRASFRSIAYERLGVDEVTLELMLGHRMPGVLGDTYMRATLEGQRREAAQLWSDWLDSQAGR